MTSPAVHHRGHTRLFPLRSFRYLIEYARRPLNLVLLAVVPVVFVTLSAGAIADFADVLGGLTDLGTVEAATAGWAASLLAGIAGFFHVVTSREPDRRLAAAGAGTVRVVLARLTSALGLALVAGLGALAALALRTGIADTPKVVGVTFLMALIYLGIGATVGAFVRSELNGSLIVVFAWMFDVFFGPAMGRAGGIIRVFPLHFPTLVVTDVASGHAGPLGDVGLSVLWAAAALAAGTLALVTTTRPAPLTRRGCTAEPAASASPSATASGTTAATSCCGFCSSGSPSCSSPSASPSPPTTLHPSSSSRGAGEACRSCP
ncbi:MAG: ABC transporter permease [Acidimicrobiia bacterium]|nr:ABC transporter permease [Acidimicrobiia bacterium]